VPEQVDRDDVRRLLGEGAQLIDVLPAKEYREDHLPEAINLPLRRLEKEARDLVDPTRPVIVYCGDSG
jgi:rhodanese-related sulfurtransferase